jgi:8-hydroxy-5-deazaflavin:NADPH oxidoreductase
MKIGILGSGSVAKALATGFLARGDRVMLGSRTPARLDDWVQANGPTGDAGSLEDAVAFGDWVVVATLGVAAVDSVLMARKEDFTQKVVIDVTNPLRVHAGGIELAYHQPSNGERLQLTLPDARIVKAFNTVGHQHFVKPHFSGARGVMFIAGDDLAAKTAVATLCREWHWETSDVGGIDAARYLEALSVIWIRQEQQTGNWDHAFAFTHVDEG